MLSCNLLADRVAGDALAALLDRHEIDVVCPQELGSAGARAIASRCPAGLLAPDRERRGLGVAARRPIEVRELPLAGRSAYRARFDPADWPEFDEPFELINLHLLAPHTWPYFPRRRRRDHQVADLLSFLDRAPPTARALIGDFNATPAWPAYREIAARYPDGCIEGAERPPAGTWPQSRWLPGLLRIDHCFVSGLRVARVERLALPGSDHFGLCIDLASGAPTAAVLS